MKASRHVYDTATADVAEAARGMLDRAAAVAPEQVAAERRAFDMLCMAYFTDPERALAPGTGPGGDGPLGFGMPGAQELLTPVLLAAATAVGAYLGDKAVGASRGLVRRMFARSPAAPSADEEAATRAAGPAGEPAEAVRLDPEQWREVRRIVLHTLMRHGGMPRDRAELMASAVVGDGLAEETPR
ncbi:hypothetical protein [Streptomyces aureus]|uniref:hypothetical protein n=1 Tax=Streptomyces aureus TaxID=193461 RepID=UPI00131D8DE0|nr:hypothetical protein [Streptomyces aureus]